MKGDVMNTLIARVLKLSFVAMLIIAVTGGFSTWAKAQTTLPSPSANGRHCVLKLDPILAGSKEVSKKVDLGCYDNIEDAISVATDGTVELPAGTSPYQVTEKVLKQYGMGMVPMSPVVIGTDYGDDEFGTMLGTYTYSGSSGPCTSTLSYGMTSMPSGWNDQVSSARSYSDCFKYGHFADINYGGSSIICDEGNTCFTMGAMNNQTSSEWWHYR